jgi:hypothetical protein
MPPLLFPGRRLSLQTNPRRNKPECTGCPFLVADLSARGTSRGTTLPTLAAANGYSPPASAAVQRPLRS